MGLSEQKFRISCGSNGSDGSEAMATHGLSLNKPASLALATRAKKLALDLEPQCRSKRASHCATRQLIEDGTALRIGRASHTH